eukprot:PhM_4_TR16766/c0_g2_i1/m.75049
MTSLLCELRTPVTRVDCGTEGRGTASRARDGSGDAPAVQPDMATFTLTSNVLPTTVTYTEGCTSILKASTLSSRPEAVPNVGSKLPVTPDDEMPALAAGTDRRTVSVAEMSYVGCGVSTIVKRLASLASRTDLVLSTDVDVAMMEANTGAFTAVMLVIPPVLNTDDASHDGGDELTHWSPTSCTPSDRPLRTSASVTTAVYVPTAYSVGLAHDIMALPSVTWNCGNTLLLEPPCRKRGVRPLRKHAVWANTSNLTTSLPCVLYVVPGRNVKVAVRLELSTLMAVLALMSSERFWSKAAVCVDDTCEGCQPLNKHSMPAAVLRNVSPGEKTSSITRPPSRISDSDSTPAELPRGDVNFIVRKP